MQQQLIVQSYQLPKPLSMPQQKTINKNKLSFSLKMREMIWKHVLTLMTLSPLNVLCYNYNSRTKLNLSELELLKFQPVLGHQFLYDIQPQTKKVYNPAFILILRSLKLDEQLVTNKYAKIAVQSSTTEQVQQQKKSQGLHYPLQQLEPTFLPKNHRQVPGQKAFKDAETEELSQTAKKKQGKNQTRRRRRGRL